MVYFWMLFFFKIYLFIYLEKEKVLSDFLDQLLGYILKRNRSHTKVCQRDNDTEHFFLAEIHS